MTAMRRLKQLTRYLLGTSDVCHELSSDPRWELLRVPVDSDWVDDKVRDAVKEQYSSALVQCSHGAQNVADASTFKSRSQIVRNKPKSNRRFGCSTISTRMAMLIGTASANGLAEYVSCMQTQSARTHGTHRVDDAHSARMTEKGRLRIKKVSTHDNPEDLMTKAMSKDILRKLGRAPNL